MSEVVSAANAAVRINIGESNEAIIAGLNTLTLPLGFTRGSVAVEEFGIDIDTKITTGATYDDLAFGGNFVLGDTNGQDLLRSYGRDNTAITNIRFYTNYRVASVSNHFVALNLVDDPSGFFKVTDFKTPSASKSGVFTLSAGMIVGGQTAMFGAHLTGHTLELLNGTPDTITDTANGFIDAGFVSGGCLIIENCATAGNDGIRKIAVAGVTAGTLTLTSTNGFAAPEAGWPAMRLHGGI